MYRVCVVLGALVAHYDLLRERVSTMKPEYVIVHHSATNPDVAVSDIKNAHLDRGFDDIGYHYLVLSDGTIEKGRPEGIPGAHARGLNQRSIGICCLGNFEYAPVGNEQFEALIVLVRELILRHEIPVEHVIGHCDAVQISPEATRTRCPGERLYERLEVLRSRVKLSSKSSSL